MPPNQETFTGHLSNLTPGEPAIKRNYNLQSADRRPQARKLNKTKRQRNTQQMQERGKNPQDQTSEEEAIYLKNTMVLLSSMSEEGIVPGSMTNFPSILSSWPSPRHAPSVFKLPPSSRSPVYITPTTGQNINISNCLSIAFPNTGYMMHGVWVRRGGKGLLFNFICNYDSIQTCAGMPALCLKGYCQ